MNKRFDKILIFIAIFVALFGLFGWITGELFFAQFSALFIPIAPSTALSFLLISTVILLKYSNINSTWLNIVKLSLLFIIICFSIIIISDWIFDFHWDIENIFIKNPDEFGEVKTGRMSPLTAFLLILEATAVLIFQSTMSKLKKNIFGLISFFSFFSSTILVIGYLYNAPLLYGGSTIPVALPTAFCFLLISFSLLITVKFNFFPFSILVNSSTGAELTKSFLPVIVFLLILNSYLNSVILVNLHNPTLTSAIVLILAIILIGFVIIYISRNLGYSLEKAINELNKAKGISEQNELELKKAQEITHIGSWYLDISTNEAKWTEELYKMYGFDPQKPVPPYTEHMKLFTPESWEILSSSLEKTRNTGIPYELELRTIRKDKTNGWMWVRGEALQKDGITIGLWGAAQDITERKNLELKYKEAKEKAEESDRLKTAFLANMSHEIRTPMNGILGFTDLLASNYLSEEKRAYYANIVKSSSQQLLNIISDIIDISKIEAKEFTLSETTFPLLEFLNEVIEQGSVLLKQKNKTHIRLYTDFIDNDIQLTTDRNRLSQIMLNLVTNSIKFTDTGHIRIGCNKITSENATFYVEDTGIGIDKSMHELIFERFRQVNDKTFESGTGLGLSICKALVKNMGGEIQVESEPAKGSKFTFTITQSKPVNSFDRTADITEPILQNRKAKILIAEDEEINYLYLYEVLNSGEFDLIHAENGKIAVELFKQENPDIILMDIKMPVMDGYEALHEIQKINNAIPVIAITAYAMSSDEKKAIEAGFRAYLSKPVSKEKIWNIINQNL